MATQIENSQATLKHEANGPQRRPAWRRRLIDVERGITLGVRRDSALFVHMFVGCVILATSFVLSLSIVQWAIVILALTVVFAAEMFHQVLQAIWQTARDEPTFAPLKEAIRIASAATFLTFLGSAIAIGLILTARGVELFSR